MEDPYNLILILWLRWMELTSCSLPRQPWFGEGYHPSLQLPQSVLGEILNSEKFLKVIHALFGGRPTRIYMGCSLLRLHGCAEGYHSTCSSLELPRIHSWRTIKFEKTILLLRYPIPRSLDSNLQEFEFLCILSGTHFYASYWPIFAFLAILHVCTLCEYLQVTHQGV